MKEELFIQSAIQQFKDYKALAEKTFAQLSDADFHFQPDVANNSLAVNITHMHGNMLSRWTNFLTEDGEKEWRQRDAEFEATHLDRVRLMELWEAGWQCLFNALESLKPADLERIITIRTRPLTVIEAVHRQLTHYAYHVGQIIFIGKQIRNDQWESLSIKKGDSKIFNEQLNSGNR